MVVLNTRGMAFIAWDENNDIAPTAPGADAFCDDA